MLVFVDDSGDAGFRIDKGSSSHFVIACCVFTTSESAESTANEIRNFKSEYHLAHKSELKFSKTKKDINLSFISRFSYGDFFVRAIIFDKLKVRSTFLIQDQDAFYNYAIMKVLSRSNGTIEDARVRIDGTGGRDYKRATSTYLRTQANSNERSIIKDVKFVNSQGDQLIQLADMVAGCIRRSFDSSKADASEFKRAISPLWRKTDSNLWIFE